jgi:Flp pilus assembly protein CpaB
MGLRRGEDAMEINRHRALPGGRAVVGGLLMALAAVGIYVAYEQASARPTTAVVVADRDLRAGDVLGADDLRAIEADLPDAVAVGTFGSVDALIGRVVLGPIASGELVQAATVTDGAAAGDVHEVALALPRGQIAVGRLKQGERVDVFATSDERTTSVVRGAAVVQIDAEQSGSLTSSREVTLVVAVPSGDAVAAVVHALRTADVTVVRSTFSEGTQEDPLEFTDEDATSPTPSSEAGD